MGKKSRVYKTRFRCFQLHTLNSVFLITCNHSHLSHFKLQKVIAPCHSFKLLRSRSSACLPFPSHNLMSKAARKKKSNLVLNCLGWYLTNSLKVILWKVFSKGKKDTILDIVQNGTSIKGLESHSYC